MRSNSVRSMEMMTMNAAWIHDVGSARQLKLSKRMGELDKDAQATFDSKLGEGLTHWMDGLFISGVKVEEEKPDCTKLKTPSVHQAKEGFSLAVVKCARSWLDAKLLTQDPIQKRYVTLGAFHLYGMYGFSVQTKAACIELEESFGGEAGLTQAMEEYDFHVDGPPHKEIDQV